MVETSLRELAGAYAKPGPRYTSYPTALEFGPMEPVCYAHALAEASARVDEGWSVYVHVPFCAKRCAFCACSVVATREYERVAAPYVHTLIREIEMVGARIGARRRLDQLHIGGGTPTYLSPVLLGRLFDAIDEQFERTPGAEWSIELDARATTPEHVTLLGERRVTRVSLGVQDLDPDVQAAIGRVQSRERIAAVTEACRRAGVGGVNFDLVYGLPAQTRSSLARTIEGVLEMNPDRLALYGYAHMPWARGRGNQREIDARTLPGPEARLDMFFAAREQLLTAGYRAIGMDHFARPDDPLSEAEEAGTLVRNFMGYTVRAGSDILGFGVTAIGEVGGVYVQNHPKLGRWREAIDAGDLPTARGLIPSADDRLRRAIIEGLMCRHGVDKRAIEAEFGLRRGGFDDHFAVEREALAQARADALLVDHSDALRLTATGKLFVRNVAMAFDARLRDRGPGRVGAGPRFSATV